MAFETMADLDCEKTTAIGGKNKETGKANPTTITGFFVGTRQVASKKSKTGFASLHILQTPTGNVGVWGKTNLDSKMGGVEPGYMVRISFLGMVETQNNPMYKYKVEVDKAQRIDVLPASPTEDPEVSDDADDASYSQDEQEETAEETPLDADEEEEQLEVTAPPPRRAIPPKKVAVAPDAERQAKVKALLGGSKARAS